MKPLVVLLVAFVIAFFSIMFFGHAFHIAKAARIAMAVMLIFTSIGHFAFTKGMAMMVPDIFPNKTAMVYLTGVLEIMAAAGLLVPPLIVLTGWLLIVLFVVMLPANINAAIKRIDYEKATYAGIGVHYLWFRVPLQVLFIVWVYFCAIKFR